MGEMPFLERGREGSPPAGTPASASAAAAGERDPVLEAVLSRTGDAVIVLDAGGRVTVINDRCRSLLQLRPNHEPKSLAEVIEALCGSAIDPAQCRLALTTAIEQTDLSAGCELTIVGSPDREVMVRVAPVAGQAGEAAGTLILIQDLTAQRAIERLSNTRALYEAAVVNLADGLAIMDRDERVVCWNPRMEELLRVPSERVVGRPIVEVTAKELYERTPDPEDTLRRALEARGKALSGTPATFEYVIDGSRVLQTLVFPIHGTTGLMGHGRLVRDVTHEREVDRMKTEFVSLVSHELRTPLTSIKGYVDLLVNGEVGELSADQQEFLEVVKSNADRLAALINDLLDVSRIEAGKVELRLDAVDVEELLQNVAASLRPQVVAKRQSLHVEATTAIPPALADAGRVTQILVNLLSNAHKYTPVGGTITARLRVDGERLRIDVQDTGVGLSTEEQSRLFTKFFRARNRATEGSTGTGLGLVIARSLVELHGGTIEVTSAPGAGSTFSFTLPRVRTASPTEVRRDDQALQGCVLVVDDEVDHAEVIRRYLARAGYRVAIARDGREALERADALRPELITLDINLPDIDGLTVLERLKVKPATAGIPVVLLSALPDDDRGTLLGAVDYLSKPIDRGALLDRIRRLLRDERPRTVLVADDDPDIRTLLAGHLRRAQYQVLEAADGAEAIELADRERPGLVLLDIRMPRVDGLAALQELMSRASTKDIPVLVMTASPGALEESRPIVATIDSAMLIDKPCTPRELAEAIGRCLTVRRAASSG
ncbi:MAG: response regulator [Chloroflexi bacterium]|nr:response regulator [Chloroflexota bacterium]